MYAISYQDTELRFVGYKASSKVVLSFHMKND